MVSRSAPSPAPADIHDLEPSQFLEEVHSFDFWFEAVEGYLSGLVHGHRADTAEVPMPDADRDRLITVLCNYSVGETTALEGSSGLIAIAPNRLCKVFLSTQVVVPPRACLPRVRRTSWLCVMTDPLEEDGGAADGRRQRYLLEDTGFDEVPKKCRRFYRKWKGPGDSLGPNEVLCPVCKVVIRSTRDLRDGDRVYCMPCMSRLVVFINEAGMLEARVAY